MKLKKIVAALCAAAMTVSAVAITPLFASAEGESAAVPYYAQAFMSATDYTWSSSAEGFSGMVKAAEDENYYGKVIWDGINNAGVTSDGDIGSQGIQITFNDESKGLDFVGQSIHVKLWYMTVGETNLPDVDGDYTINSNWNNTAGEVIVPVDFGGVENLGKNFYGVISVTGSLTKEVVDDEPADESFVIWTGSQEMTEDWGQSVSIDASLLANLGAEGKLVMTIESTAAGAQYAVKNVDWADLNTDYDLAEGATSFTFDMTEGYANEFKANGFRVSGKLYTLTKIEYVGKNGGASEPTTPETPSQPETPSTPAANPLAGNSTVMPVHSISLVSSNSAAAIKQLKEGDAYEYKLSASNPVIKRRVFQSIMGKDITIKVTYKDMTWEFNGKDITEPHTINFAKLYEAAKAE